MVRDVEFTEEVWVRRMRMSPEEWRQMYEAVFGRAEVVLATRVTRTSREMV